MLRTFAGLAFFLLSGLHAASQSLLLDSYSPANGLVDSRVTKLFQDSRGRMFILTHDGFSIFDGQHFDNYTSVNGIAAGLMNDVVEMPDGQVVLFNFSGDRFLVNGQNLVADSSHRSLFAELNRIFRLGDDDYLYLTNHHLLRSTKGVFKKLAFDADKRKMLYVEKAVVSGHFLVFYSWDTFRSNNFVCYDIDREKITDLVMNHLLTSLAVDAKQQVYYQAGGWYQLDQHALAEGKLLGAKPWFASRVPKDSSYQLIDFDNFGNCWLINTEKGIYRINRDDEQTAFFSTRDGLIPYVHSVVQDRENNYWFLSASFGLQKLQQSQLTLVSQISGHPLSYASIVTPTSTGDCFVNTANGSYLAGAGFAFDDRVGYPNFAFWQGQLWQFKDQQTLYGSKGSTLRLASGLPADVIPYQSSPRIHFDGQGRMLIAGSWLIAINPDLHFTVQPLPYFTDEVAIDHNNNYWCFTRSNEIVRYSWVKNELRKTGFFEMPGLNPRCVIEMSPDVFLVGTRENGIAIIEVKNDQPTWVGSIRRKIGLSNNFIYTLLKTGPEELVAGTATGLDRIYMSANDTLIENIAARNTIFSTFQMLAITPDSDVVATSSDGALYRFNRQRIQTTNFIPQLAWRMIQVNGTPVERSDDARFSFTRNNFLFSATLPTFLDNRNVRYDFRLQNGSKEWSQTGTSADFKINNLNPGSYHLVLRTSFPGRQYPEQLLEWNFVIAPPVWKTWWFISLLVVVVTGVILLMVRSYFRRLFVKQKTLLEKQQAVEQERTRIATDMHDDFGASLSRIKFLSEKMKLQSAKREPLQEDLNKISRYSDEMAEKMGEIVWALNRRYDSSGDLISFCRSYASEYLEDKNIRLVFETGAFQEKKINGEIRRNMFLVMKEALHNVVKHADATTVHIRMECDKKLELVVQDNGKGIDLSGIRRFANGMENMKKRMEEVGGQLLVTSSNGTEITASVPGHILQNTYE